ncbi:11487_t:CDS:1, partial [Racocetra persica]
MLFKFSKVNAIVHIETGVQKFRAGFLVSTPDLNLGYSVIPPIRLLNGT